MKRRLFNILTGLSLLLCVAMAGLWVRSHWVLDEFHKYRWVAGQAAWERHLLSSECGWFGWEHRQLVETDPAWIAIREAGSRLPFLLGGWLYAPRPARSNSLANYLPQMGRTRRISPDTMPMTETAVFVAVPYWVPLAIFAVMPLARHVVLPLLRAVRSAWQRRRMRMGLCPSCGYDLRATPNRCPECGTVIIAAPAAEGGRSSVGSRCPADAQSKLL